MVGERKVQDKLIEHLNNFNTWNKGLDIEILDKSNNQIYKFNRHKDACKFIKCCYPTLIRSYDNDVIIKKRYKVLKYDRHKRNTPEGTC